MGKSYVTIYDVSEDLAQSKGIWIRDNDACILSCMLGIELLTHIGLGEWAATEGRACLQKAVVGATGNSGPDLEEFQESALKLAALDSALAKMLEKLDMWRGHVPPGYWGEHNLLSPGEAVPAPYPTDVVRSAINVLRASVAVELGAHRD
jgi:hypothetical protein